LGLHKKRYFKRLKKHKEDLIDESFIAQTEAEEEALRLKEMKRLGIAPKKTYAEPILIKVAIGPNFRDEVILKADNFYEMEMLFKREVIEEMLRRHTFMTEVARVLNISIHVVKNAVKKLGIQHFSDGKMKFKSKEDELDYILQSDEK